MTSFLTPSREAALERLAAFLPYAGRDYAEQRNFVPGTVSGLSPYLRHRLLQEEEIVKGVLQRHGYEASQKFVQEVCWRTYWKGWLELRPWVWTRFLGGLRALRSELQAAPGFAERVQAAECGGTGLDCLDDWARELRETGYLHNHVRMWFASIWIHTLRLPWQLGADFFMRHLLDGDPASNTLSWRWVAGLHTEGKVYLATAENIQRYTDGRYAPFGLLAKEPPPLGEAEAQFPPKLHAPMDPPVAGEKTLLIVTEEDLCPETWKISRGDLMGIVLVDTADAYLGVSALPVAFKRGALEESGKRFENAFQVPVQRYCGSQGDLLSSLRLSLQESRAISLSIMSPTVGPSQSCVEPTLAALVEEGVRIRRLRRPWDEAFWPHATHGFFRLKKQIPDTLAALSLLQP
jgi:deoxyribodipyrimidine photo-lyase